MAERPIRQTDLGIGTMMVRGRSLSPAIGHSLAVAVAAALAHQMPGGSARIGEMTLQLPASAVGADGGIDPAALAHAVAHARRDRDA